MYIPSGWSLRTLPFTSVNLSAEAGLGDCNIYGMSGGKLVGGRTFPTIKPGYAYWIYCPTERNLVLDVTPTQQKSTYTIELSPGWNLVGAAFDEDMDWTGGRIKINNQVFNGNTADLRPYRFLDGEYQKATGTAQLKKGQGELIYSNSTSTVSFAGNNPVPQVEWAVMVYMAADNSLSEAAMADLAEIVGSGSSVAYFVQVEFSSSADYGTSTVPAELRGKTVRYRYDHQGPIIMNNLDMADPRTLTDFITWADGNVDANKKLLVMWDHGSGWNFAAADNPAGAYPRSAHAIFQDETSDDLMSTTDAAKAVRDSGLHFDVLLFDACLMGMYEDAYEFKDTSDYMVFSESLVPYDGAPYDVILPKLGVTPYKTGEQLASLIVDDFYNYYKNIGMESITMSALRSSKINDLHSQVTTFSAAIQQALGQDKHAQFHNMLLASQYYQNSVSVDIYNLAQNISISSYFKNAPLGAEAGNFMRFIDTSGIIVNNKFFTGAGQDEPSLDRSHGIAVYFPAEEAFLIEATDKDELRSYDYIAANRNIVNSWADAVYLYLTFSGYYP